MPSNKLGRSISVNSILLALFAVVGAFMLAGTAQLTKSRIAENARAQLLANLGQLLPEHFYNNDPYAAALNYGDIYNATKAPLLDRENDNSARLLNLYPAMIDTRRTAFVADVVAFNGYSGKIRMLVGVMTESKGNGVLLGVRVIDHKETPGLGDKIDVRKSDWIKQFAGKSMFLDKRQFKMSKNGGDIDALSGATISSRAVAKTAQQVLTYYQLNGKAVFDK